MALSSLSHPPSRFPRPRRETPEHVIDQLKAAISADDMDSFRELVSVQAHIPELYEVMCEALARDHADAASELLRRSMSVNYVFVLDAIAAGAKNCLVVFFDAGWDVNAAISDTETSVFAYAFANRELALWPLERGADLNKRSVTDLTPLSHAVEYAAPGLLQELLNRGDDVQKGEVLQHALERSTDVVTVLGILLDKGAPLDAVMYANHSSSRRLYFFIERGTPLCKAAAIGNAEAVRFLLGRGADASIANSKAGPLSSVLSGRDSRRLSSCWLADEQEDSRRLSRCWRRCRVDGMSREMAEHEKCVDGLKGTKRKVDQRIV